MALTIPAEFPTFSRGEYLVTKDIDAEDWVEIIKAHHRVFAESGSRIPGMWPYPDSDDPSFKTASTTWTQNNTGSVYDWDLWQACLSLNRDTRDGTSEVLLLTFTAVLEQVEVRYIVVAEDPGGTSTSLGTVTLTPAGSAVELVSDTLSITSAAGDLNGSAGNEPRTITIYAEGQGTANPTIGTCYIDHIHEYRLTVSDTAKLPRGY